MMTMVKTKARPRKSTKDVKVVLRERTREIEVLHRISESISSTLDLAYYTSFQPIVMNLC